MNAITIVWSMAQASRSVPDLPWEADEVSRFSWTGVGSADCHSARSQYDFDIAGQRMPLKIRSSGTDRIPLLSCSLLGAECLVVCREQMVHFVTSIILELRYADCCRFCQDQLTQPYCWWHSTITRSCRTNLMLQSHVSSSGHPPSLGRVTLFFSWYQGLRCEVNRLFQGQDFSPFHSL